MSVTKEELAGFIRILARDTSSAYELGIRQLHWPGTNRYTCGLERQLKEMIDRETAASLGLTYEDWVQ